MRFCKEQNMKMKLMNSVTIRTFAIASLLWLVAPRAAAADAKTNRSASARVIVSKDADPEKEVVVKVVEDEDTELLLSAVSIWEIALKARAGKLEIPEDKSFFQEQMGLLGIQFVLPIEATHVFEVFSLPDYHRDPFDRLLVAQCIAERIPLIASDAAMRRYPVEVIW